MKKGESITEPRIQAYVPVGNVLEQVLEPEGAVTASVILSNAAQGNIGCRVAELYRADKKKGGECRAGGIDTDDTVGSVDTASCMEEETGD